MPHDRVADSERSLELRELSRPLDHAESIPHDGDRQPNRIAVLPDAEALR